LRPYKSLVQLITTFEKETIMKRSRKLAIGIAAALGLGLGLGAATVIAQPGGMAGGVGSHMPGQGGMHAKGGMGHGPMSQQQLLTPEERSAFQEKMHNAKTPEERQKIAEANRAEIEKRAKDKGITLPEPHGPRAGFGPHSGPASR
jgi:Spy/CpxP family protein refolding chaperone